MKLSARQLKQVVLEVFVFTMLFNIFIYILRHFNILAFPGIEQRILVITMLLGIAVVFLNAKTIKNMTLTSSHPKSKKSATVPRKNTINVKKYSLFSNDIKKIWQHIRLHYKRIIIYAISAVLYAAFLFYIFPILTTEEFMFFVVLAYVPISLKFGLDPRYPVGVALFLLILMAISMSQGHAAYAEAITVYSYYFLVVGVFLAFVDFLVKER